MVVVGVDVHKSSHTFVAVDPVGKKLGQLTAPATTTGHHAAIRWAHTQFGTDLLWGIEDCRQMSTRLERDLLTAGQTAVRVPTKMMAHTRASARTRGKSDPIDALAVARAVLREPNLPAAGADPRSREIRLLVDRREVFVAQRTSTINRLLWRVHEINPAYAPKPRSLSMHKHQQILAAQLATETGLLADIAREELDEIISLTTRINSTATEIGKRVRELVPSLLQLPGCGELTAAKIVGETAGIARFRSVDAYANYAGTAPIPVWSGNTAGRVRLPRCGNRQLTTALHRIALTQTRLEDSDGYTYYRKRRAAGDSTTAALRALRRRLVRTVYQRLITDTAPQPRLAQTSAA